MLKPSMIIGKSHDLIVAQIAFVNACDFKLDPLIYGRSRPGLCSQQLD